jgi:lysophospholipase L1-like esterase
MAFVPEIADPTQTRCQMKYLPLLLFLAWTAPHLMADAAPRTYRIMPVGDSITEGGKSFSVYRVPLLEKLKAAGYSVQYVGSRSSDSPLGRLEHEGYGGKNAEYLASVVGKSFHDHPADIVLLHAGHNHNASENPVAKIVAANESMIATFRKANPKVIVLLAQVIPSQKLPKYAYIPELNKALAKLAARLDTPAQPVILINQAEGFDPATDTIADKVHPNAQGADKMASRWFDALVKILQKSTAEN